MNNTEARVMGTFFIWVAFTVVGVAAMVTGDGLNLLSVFVMILLTGGAVTATQHVWKGGEESEKSKRRDKLDRVIARLSEQDIAELRARLMAEGDGEAVSLDELMERRGS